MFTRKKLVSCEHKYKVQLYLQTFLNTKVQIDQCASTLNPLFTMPNTLSAQENNSPKLIYVHLKSQALYVTLSHSFPPPVTVKW